MNKDEARPRPQFAARAAYVERNPVTGIREPAFPKSIRRRRMAAGMGIIMVMVGNAFCVNFAMFIITT